LGIDPETTVSQEDMAPSQDSRTKVTRKRPKARLGKEAETCPT